jgi:hypothetical protein
MVAIMHFHYARSWNGHTIEDECPCPQEPCGFVDVTKADPHCLHHAPGQIKTMRQIHSTFRCPSRTKDDDE